MLTISRRNCRSLGIRAEMVALGVIPSRRLFAPALGVSVAALDVMTALLSLAAS